MHADLTLYVMVREVPGVDGMVQAGWRYHGRQAGILEMLGGILYDGGWQFQQGQVSNSCS